MHSARVPASYVLGGDIRATPSPSGFGCCACSAVERLQGMDVCRTGGSQSRVIAVYTLNLRGNETGLRGRVLSGRSLSSVGGAGNPPPPSLQHPGPSSAFSGPSLPPPPPRVAPRRIWAPGVTGSNVARARVWDLSRGVLRQPSAGRSEGPGQVRPRGWVPVGGGGWWRPGPQRWLLFMSFLRPPPEPRPPLHSQPSQTFRSAF